MYVCIYIYICIYIYTHIEMARNFIPLQPDIDMEIHGFSKDNDLLSCWIFNFPYLC